MNTQDVDDEVHRQRANSALLAWTGSVDIIHKLGPSSDSTHPSQITPITTQVPDGGYGWIIVLCTGVICVCFAFLDITFAMLLIAFKEAFPDHLTGTLSLLATVKTVCCLVVTVFVSAPMKVYGLRATMIAGLIITAVGLALASLVHRSLPGLFLTFGVFTGIGTGIFLSPTFTIVQLYFNKRRALAAGMSMVGLSVGTMTSAIVTKHLLDVFGLQGTLLLMSGLSVQCIVCAALCRPFSAQHKDSEIYDKSMWNVIKVVAKDITNFSHLKNIWFSFYVIAGFCTICGSVGLAIHAPSRIIDRGFDRNMAAFSTTAYGVGGLLGRIVQSAIANMESVSATAQFGMSVLAGGCMIIAIIYITPYWGVIVAMAVYATFTSGTMSIQITAMVDMFGKEDIARKTTFILVGKLLGALTGIFLAGWLYDVMGNYDSPYYVIGSIQMFGGALVITSVLWNYRKPKTTKQQQTIALTESKQKV